MATAPPSAGKRPYRMRVRAEQVAATRERMLASAMQLFGTRFYDEVSLDDVAAGAETTVQTVIRHFGSKDALFAAVADWSSDRMVAPREEARPGDVGGAVRGLVDHYEQWGDAVFLLLSQEDRVPAIRPQMDEGRAYHRDWVERLMGDSLAPLRGAARERRLAQLIAVTDLYTWKLLRRDLGLGRRQTETAIRELIEALGRED
jgi:AcrR family transcriptional regulator